MGIKIVQLLWKKVWQVLYNLAIPFLAIYSKDVKSYAHYTTCTRMFTAAFFVIVKNTPKELYEETGIFTR